jgi:hypothetical protein
MNVLGIRRTKYEHNCCFDYGFYFWYGNWNYSWERLNMETYHFEVRANKQIYAFHSLCNKINYSNNNYLLFFNVSEEGERLLGMLPHASITEVISVVDSSDENP